MVLSAYIPTIRVLSKRAIIIILFFLVKSSYFGIFRLNEKKKHI